MDPPPVASTSAETLDGTAAPAPTTKSRLGGCALCAEPARYKCPCCSTATCSLAHSTAHKTLTAPPCSGKAKPQYALDIKANELTWGALMRDQSYLSSLSRNVEGVGRDLVRDKLLPGVGPGRAEGSGERLDGRSEKEERLVREAQREGVRLVLLPKGMHKRLTNATRFDHKQSVVHWSLEFIVHPPPSATSAAPAAPITFLLSPQPSSTHIFAILSLALDTRDRKRTSASNKLSEAERPPAPSEDERKVEQRWINGFKPAQDEDAPMTDGEEEDDEGDEPPFVLLMRVYTLPGAANATPPAPGRPYQILPLSPAPACTLKSMLEGSSLLEYPTLELWPLEKLIAARKSNEITVLDRKSATALREEMEAERGARWERGRGRGAMRGSTRGGRGGARGGFASGEEASEGRTQDNGWGKRAEVGAAEGEPEAKRVRMQLDEDGNVEVTLGDESEGEEAPAAEDDDDSSLISSDDSEDEERVGEALLGGLVEYDSD